MMLTSATQLRVKVLATCLRAQEFWSVWPGSAGVLFPDGWEAEWHHVEGEALGINPRSWALFSVCGECKEKGAVPPA